MAEQLLLIYLIALNVENSARDPFDSDKNYTMQVDRDVNKA